MANDGAPIDPATPRPETSAPAGAGPRLAPPPPENDHGPAPESREPATSPPAKPAVRPVRRRKRDSALVGYLSGVFTFLTLLVFLAGGAFVYARAKFNAPGPLANDTTVLIARNQGVDDIAKALNAAGVIDEPKLFEYGAHLSGAKLRYGEYGFPAHVSMREAMEIIASGKSIEYTVTIPEGLTSLQVVERLRDQPLLTGDVKETPPEGSLLPETYNFTRGASRQQIIERMQAHQKAALDEIWAKRRPSPKIRTPEELVTLASLVEKETGVAEERPRVAAVFENRLARGMRLQSDPTIVYGLVGGRGTLGRSLNRSDIASKTPYNTYVISGLPAGPIANPGREAMEAVANPAETKDLYFVADGSGGHAFAPSLIEHNKNVAKWRQLERAKGPAADRVSPDDAPPETAADDAGDDPKPAEAAPEPAPKKPAKRKPQ